MHSLRLSIPARGVYCENLEIEIRDLLVYTAKRGSAQFVAIMLCIWEALISFYMERGVQLGWIGCVGVEEILYS
jgi:hypothetical protein